MDGAKKENLKRETESILIAAENNAIRTNPIKTRIDMTQQNSRCRLCDDRDEMINHMINECSKLTRNEFKTKHGWVGMVIHCKLYKKLKLDHTNKWYIHNPASFLGNETHNLLSYCEIQTDHQMSARRPDLVIIYKEKRTCRVMDLSVSADHRVKLKKKDQKER